ncbi:MAG: 50S ribosomal protein L22 [Alphaproteobacteria bacterium]|nr:50S ribosomal protein L22 [Alphaproteobacteria bacterium]MCL2504781.1 50S ribosomal protein L22 [Alphaproteobacteria bacterium]
MAYLKKTLKEEGGAMAKASTIRSSARKLNLVAASIRGMAVAAALAQLTFEKRRVSNEVKKVLLSAIANAENNNNLNIDKLYVSEAWVGRAFVMKRFHARGRGKSAGIEKPFSNLTIVVKEREAVAKRTSKAKNDKVKSGTRKTAAKSAKKEKVGA